MFGEINDLRLRPLPALESSRVRKTAYRDCPIDQTGPLYLEPLAYAGAFGIDGRNYYAHARNPPYWAVAEGAIDALLVRESVGAKLAAVDSRLKREGLKLFLFDEIGRAHV